jgi:RNA polymerase subunit RPABC4/transcription elongation factor Spt4
LAEDAKKLIERQKEIMTKAAAPVSAAKPEAAATPANLSEDEMLCPNCRTVISKDAVMCYACGQKIKEEVQQEVEEVTEEEVSSDEEIPCPNCKTMISRDALMCYACGTNVKDALAKQELKAEAAEGQGDDKTFIKKPQIFVKKIVKKKTV